MKPLFFIVLFALTFVAFQAKAGVDYDGLKALSGFLGEMDPASIENTHSIFAKMLERNRVYKDFFNREYKTTEAQIDALSKFAIKFQKGQEKHKRLDYLIQSAPKIVEEVLKLFLNSFKDFDPKPITIAFIFGMDTVGGEFKAGDGDEMHKGGGKVFLSLDLYADKDFESVEEMEQNFRTTFIHELGHAVHHQANPDFQLIKSKRLIERLWSEGIATYTVVEIDAELRDYALGSKHICQLDESCSYSEFINPFIKDGKTAEDLHDILFPNNSSEIGFVGDEDEIREMQKRFKKYRMLESKWFGGSWQDGQPRYIGYLLGFKIVEFLVQKGYSLSELMRWTGETVLVEIPKILNALNVKFEYLNAENEIFKFRLAKISRRIVLTKEQNSLPIAIPEGISTKLSILFDAVRSGNIEAAREAIGNRNWVNTRSPLEGTPLNVAVEQENTDMARLLLDYGAQIDVSDVFGKTPLAEACMRGNEELVDLLLKRDADVSLNPDDTTLLIIAVKFGSVKIVQDLLDQGVDTFQKDCDGKTALQHAQELGKKDIIAVLLARS